MTTYDTLRHFADSHALVAMVALFLILCLWPFRPGGADRNEQAANSIFEDSDDGE